MRGRHKYKRKEFAFWLRDFKHRQKRLREILTFLDTHSNSASLTDDQFRTLRIDMSDLDLDTGKTSSSVTPYFMPSCDEAFKVSNSGIDPADDRFARYNRSNTRRVYKDDGRSEFLEMAFRAYASRSFDHSGLKSWKSIL